jgi:molybdenum cofactor cytidylyltransferase
MQHIAAIILAAGKGRRIGCPKWKLQHLGTTFLSLIAKKLLQVNIEKIICVTTVQEYNAQKKELTAIGEKIEFQINQNPTREMISSIYWGIQKVPSYAGYLIMPVDHPHISILTLQKLCASHLRNCTYVTRPVYKQRPGHPIIIPNQAAVKITNTNISGGLRSFLQLNHFRSHDIPVDDSAILLNINTEQDIYV